MTFPGLLNFYPLKSPLGSGGSNLFRFESVPYPSEYVCQIWLRSDRRECNAGTCMTIAKCTKTAASSNVSNLLQVCNHLSRTPAAWCASGAAHHAWPYRNLGRRISLRSYTIVGWVASAGSPPKQKSWLRRWRVFPRCTYKVKDDPQLSHFVS